MIRFLLSLISGFLAITLSASKLLPYSEGTTMSSNIENNKELFQTYSTIFQDYCQPAKLIQFYPFNIYCGWQPGKVVFSERGKILSNDYYQYDDSGNLLEYRTANASNEVSEIITYKYDKAGRLVFEEDFLPISNFTWRKEYEYNSDGYVSKFIDTDDNGEKVTKAIQEYQYDDILKNYLIKTVYTFEGTEDSNYQYVTSDEETRIHRNALGNITKYESYTHYVNGLNSFNHTDTIPNWYVEIEYDNDNIARNIKRYILNNSTQTFKLEKEYSDIEWYCTNGQILFELISASGSSITLPYLTEESNGNIGDYWTKLDKNNLIKEVTITDYAELNYPNSFRYHFSYPGYFGSYICDIYYNDMLITTEKYYILNMGIERERRGYMVYDISSDSFIPSDYLSILISHENQYGLTTKVISKEGQPDDLYEKITNTEIEFYDESFLPCSFVIGIREFTYSEYHNTIAAVESVNKDKAPTRYFTIQGVEVNGQNLIPGLYIKLTGDHSEKILIK